jgi:peroxiredoxin
MKSWLLYPAAAASGVLAVAALIAAAMAEDARMAWLGAAVAGLPLPLFIARTRLMPIVRTSENLPLLLLVSATGLVIAGWEAYMERQAEWPPVAVALAGSLLLVLYVFAYSRFGRFPSPKLAVGNKLPEFDLTGLDEGSVRSAGFGGQSAVFLFFSGDDCPFCMGQVREIAARYAELRDLGIHLVLVSPQPAARTRKLAAETGLSASFSVDRGNRAAEALGIAKEGRVMPTVVVTNSNGTILYSDQTDNYRVRPEPDIYISILKRAGAISSPA